jgi:putative selenate reductase FAD-binding subunit
MITEILRPGTVQEALKARTLPNTAFLGGGTWLNAAPSPDPLILISLERLGLGSIEAAPERCLIGATATFRQVLDHDTLPSAVRRAASLTASRTLRNMVTIGGEIALNPVDSALVPVLLAMEAEISVAGKKKPLPIDQYLAGAGGLILSVSIPGPSHLCAVRSVSRTSHSGRSLVIAACAAAVQPRFEGLRIFASDCRGSMVRLRQAEDALEGRPIPPRAEIESTVGRSFVPQPDIHASMQYKLYMVGVLVADVLQEMAGRRGPG